MTTAVQVQHRRGTATQVAAFAGAAGELVVDTTNNRVVVQDGSTAGGFAAAKLSEVVSGVKASDGAVVTMSGTVATVGGPGGLVNKFRNGTMDVWQRGTGPITVTTAGGYAADGWIVVPSGASVTVAQAGGRLLTKNSMQVTGAASVTGLVVRQRIESLIAAAFCSQTVTVQAQIYNGTGGTITPTLTIKHAGSQDSWGSPVTDISAAALQACPAGSWSLVAYALTASASAYNGLEVGIDFGNNLGAGTKTVQLAECDIRVTPGAATGLNANPPPPELRPISTELPFCQRYFWQYKPGSSVNSFLGGAGGSTSAATILQFPVTMRAAPSASVSAAGDWTANAFGTGGGAATASSFSNATASGIQWNLSTSGLTAGQALWFEAGNASAFVCASAEL